VHDFSPWTLPNGLFWIVKVPDSAVQFHDDGSVTLQLVDVPVVDAYTFPPPAQTVPGISPIQLNPAKLSLDITYEKGGNPHRVRPTSHDPLSPFNWAGMMWDSTNSGTFSLSYDDGSFSASGSFASNGNFGEIGFERNGVFLRDGDFDQSTDQSASSSTGSRLTNHAVVTSPSSAGERTVLLKGRVPVKVVR
jgi:hypothetical protein